MSVSEEIHKAVEGLSPDDQRKVLSFVLQLKHSDEDPAHQPDVTKLVGIMSKEDGVEIMRAVEEAFETIEPGEW